jgi:hypothetical protein
VELGEDPPDVGLDRLLGDDQVAGDLGPWLASSDGANSPVALR